MDADILDGVDISVEEHRSLSIRNRMRDVFGLEAKNEQIAAIEVLA